MTPNIVSHISLRAFGVIYVFLANGRHLQGENIL